jgi:hypothetical protein
MCAVDKTQYWLHMQFRSLMNMKCNNDVVTIIRSVMTVYLFDGLNHVLVFSLVFLFLFVH